ncbi:ankyrin repeat domain-containing protein SOWAHA [Protopterus annectens]|uniref:ankyrin repeat domain-containing protein SOWAHA n=1 Tax=Protopterus annectens TaxID=7888 RepID=UPI001CF9F509|nr:ankyrin repeat domain-containing protein SOWAHA [Protopterus annectens]
MANVTEAVVLKFLLDRGGKVKHSELLDEFRPVADPESTSFKKHVNSVADLKDEDGIIYAVLKKWNQRLTEKVPEYQENSGENLSGLETQTVTTAESGTGGELHEKVHDDLEQAETNAEVSKLEHGTGDSLPHTQGRLFPDKLLISEENMQAGELSLDGNQSLPTVLVEECSPTSEVHTLTEQDKKCADSFEQTKKAVQKPCMLPIRCHPVHIPSHVKAQESPQSESSSDIGSADFPAGKPDHIDTSKVSLTPPKSPRMRRRQLEEAPSSPFVKRGFKHFTAHYDSQYYYDIPLEPVHHQWLVNAAAGRWTQLYGMLLKDTHLAGVKDFMSGYTALHWAAKSGDSQMLSKIIDAAIKDNIPIDVNIRSYGGYTPLHIASIHGHEDVIFRLVGYYNAKINIRDHSGKKPYQYLTKKASLNVRRELGDPNSLKISENMLPKRGSKVTSSFLLSTTSTLLGVMADDSVIHDLATGFKKPKKPKFLTSTAKQKPKVRGTLSSVYEDAEEVSEKALKKPRSLSDFSP